MNFLIADDNEINLHVACAHLKSIGIPAGAIKTAVNGLEAKNLCQKNHYDLIFMDIQMPELDGIEATKQILKLCSVKPKIVALTANANQDAEQDFYNAGMKMIIRKPVEKSAFIQALKLIDFKFS